MIKRIFKWIGRLFASLICLLIVAILVLSQMKGILYKNFLEVSAPGVRIPGLNLKLCPQGIAYAQEQETHIFVGYMTTGEPSKLHIVDKDNNVKMLHLKNADGSPHKGHVGGISTTGNHVFITGENMLYHLELNALLSSLDDADIVLNDFFPLDIASSYTFANDEKLYVGEFYRQKGYPTDPTHKVQVGNETHRAFVYEYDLNASKRYGVEEVPSKIYSVIDEVQGFAITKNGSIVLSCSYSIMSSRLHIYQKIVREPDLMYAYDENTQLPVYHVGKKDQIKKYDLMPMSEDLEYKDGILYINFESASQKYRMFNMYQTKTVYTMRVD